MMLLVIQTTLPHLQLPSTIVVVYGLDATSKYFSIISYFIDLFLMVLDHIGRSNPHVYG